MPVNLNALIRYKAIDECLSNPQLDCTIETLISKCFEKITEFKGINSGVSERTIRNDIRVLRSDILGFNAPIVVKDGIYKYSNSDFSIFGRPIKELMLLHDIQGLLVKEFSNLKNEHKNLSELLLALSKITKVNIPIKCYPSGNENTNVSFKIIGNISKKDTYRVELKNYISHLNSNKDVFRDLFKNRNNEFFNWKFIFEILHPLHQS